MLFEDIENYAAFLQSITYLVDTFTYAKYCWLTFDLDVNNQRHKWFGWNELPNFGLL